MIHHFISRATVISSNSLPSLALLKCRRITAGITMLTHFVDEIIVFAPFVLPLTNWSLDSGKTNGVMPAHVRRHASVQLKNSTNPPNVGEDETNSRL